MSVIVHTVIAIFFLHATSASASLLNNVSQVSAGLTHTCALENDGTVACWGSNSWGELGDGSTTPHLKPTLVLDGTTGVAMSGFTQIATGSAMTCGIRSGGVYCWGYAYPGVSQPWPTRVPIYDPVKTIAMKGESVCALLGNAQRSMRCWGDNYNGQLGDGTKTSRGTPVDVVITERDGSKSLLAGLTSIAVGIDHACAVLDDTSVACWGFNWAGELGNETFTDSLSPVTVVVGGTTLTDIERIAVNGLHSCAKFASTWALACWGNNSQGQLGDPAVTVATASPVGVSLGVSTIDAGSESTCAKLADGRLACWGGNGYGQLGIGSTTKTGVPTVISAIPKITSLSVGAYHACAVLPDTTVRCWGLGNSGQLGNGGTTTINPSPVAVVGLSTF